MFLKLAIEVSEDLNYITIYTSLSSKNYNRLVVLLSYWRMFNTLKSALYSSAINYLREVVKNK